MRLTSPWWLVLGILVVAALIAGAVAASRRRSAALAAAGLTAGGPAYNPRALAQHRRLAVLALAAAGPAASVPVARAAGTVIVAMDVSNSMAATDVSPSRLAAAKQAAGSFIDAQPDSVDVGVVAFQNGGLTTYRPSADRAAAKTAVGPARRRRRHLTGQRAAHLAVGDHRQEGGDRQGRHRAGHRVLELGDDRAVLRRRGPRQRRGHRGRRRGAEKAGVHVETVGVGTTAGATVTVDKFRIHTALDRTR
jgi:Ca-activated chloride channel family protein